VLPGDDPFSASQGYLTAAPVGIDARWAWEEGATDGTGVALIDLEQGWALNHEDLADAAIPLVSGLNASFHGHGTAVLGEIVAVDNQRGCIGIAPRATASVVSQRRADGTLNIADAILDAVRVMHAGDVLLLEAQSEHVTNSYVPVEIAPVVRDAIKAAVARGIVVVEAAGNGKRLVGADLDLITDTNGRRVFDRAHADFQDSGAILVGAGSSTTRARLNFSNFGSRVDCYAWGENIRTCGDGEKGTATTGYTRNFGGTSGAAPIVAGAALLLQSARKRAGVAPYTPDQMRQLLSDRMINTGSANPAVDRIGVMPDLRAIVERERSAGALPATPPPAVTVAPTAASAADASIFPRPVLLSYVALAALTAGNALLPAAPPPGVQTVVAGPSIDFSAPGTIELSRAAQQKPQAVVFVKSDDDAVVNVTFDAVLVDHAGKVLPTERVGASKVDPGQPKPIPVTFTLNSTYFGLWDARLPARGSLILSAAKGNGPRTIRIRDLVVPQVQPAALELVVTLVSLVPAVTLLLWSWSKEAAQPPPDSAPPWTLRSWSSNLAIGGALLTSLLGLMALPTHTHYMAKASYTVLSPFFAALIALAPAVYDLMKAGGTPTPSSALRLFGTAAAITLWATLGQLGTTVFLFLELEAARVVSGVAAVTAALVVVAVGVAVISNAFKAIQSHTDPANAVRLRADEKTSLGRPGRWALL
jgi:hypothetical protein